MKLGAGRNEFIGFFLESIIDRQIDRQTDRQTGRQTGRWIDRLVKNSVSDVPFSFLLLFHDSWITFCNRPFSW